MIDFIKRHKLFILFVILFIASTAMYSRNLKNKSNLNGFQSLILDITMPINNLIEKTTSSIASSIDNYFFLVDVKTDNLEQLKEIARLQSRVKELTEHEITNSRLRELLNFSRSMKTKSIPAEVISKGSSTWINTIIIDKGLNDGVIPGLAVVSEKGIIGHTIYTSKNYAQVLLITDKNCAVDVINQRSRAKGIVKGYNKSLCKINYVLRKEDLVADDVIITSGMDGIFPKGLSVGKVREVSKSRHDLFQNATLEPYVDFEKLEEVLVIIRGKEQLEEIKSIKESR
ncbi:rod shape-determining protein MreC [Thermodesulfobacteriota bacterium]